MSTSNRIDWQELSRAYAFLGNTLLAPIAQTEHVGLSEEFWRAFPTFGDEELARACADMGKFCSHLQEVAKIDPVTDVSVEYTHLFVGPPKPAAAPWETAYRGEHRVNYGFGQATFEIRAALSSAGLKLSNENNQYEDHMGIELLFLSVLCQRVSDASPSEIAKDKVADFIAAHPQKWAGEFRKAVCEQQADGYFDNLLGVVEALLRVGAMHAASRQR